MQRRCTAMTGRAGRRFPGAGPMSPPPIAAPSSARHPSTSCGAGRADTSYPYNDEPIHRGTVVPHHQVTNLPLMRRDKRRLCRVLGQFTQRHLCLRHKPPDDTSGMGRRWARPGGFPSGLARGAGHHGRGATRAATSSGPSPGHATVPRPPAGTRHSRKPSRPPGSSRHSHGNHADEPRTHRTSGLWSGTGRS